MTGTTPATAPSNLSWTEARQQLLVGGHDVSPGPHGGQHVGARRLDPAHQLDDEIGALEDLLEIAL
jgi:hypothetical protein